MFTDFDELMKGVTDLPITLCALVLAVLLAVKGKHGWAKLYFLITASALVGAAVHALKMTDAAKTAVWIVLYIGLYEVIRRFALLMISYIKGDPEMERMPVFVLEAVMYLVNIACLLYVRLFNDILVLILFAGIMILRVVACFVKQKKAPTKAYVIIAVLAVPTLLQALESVIPCAVVAEHIVLAAALFIGYLIGCESVIQDDS